MGNSDSTGYCDEKFYSTFSAPTRAPDNSLLRGFRRVPTIEMPAGALLILLAVLLASVYTTCAQPLMVCSEPEYHFPPTANTGIVEHAFVLSNDGTAPLVIRRIQPDCGCVLVRTPPESIEPGGSIDIKTRFDLHGRRGEQRRRITVFSNARNQPRLVLTMIGEVVAEAAVTPDRLFWGNISGDREEQREALVEFSGVGNAVVTGVLSGHPGFEADIDIVDIGQTYRLIWRTDPSLAPQRFDFNSTIRTDHPRYPELTLRMSGRITAAVFVIPDEITLSTGARRVTDVFLIVRAIAGESFDLLEVIPPLPEITVRRRDISGGGARVELRNVPVSSELDGKEIKLITNHPRTREIVVPIRVKSTGD